MDETEEADPRTKRGTGEWLLVALALALLV